MLSATAYASFGAAEYTLNAIVIFYIIGKQSEFIIYIMLCFPSDNSDSRCVVMYIHGVSVCMCENEIFHHT